MGKQKKQSQFADNLWAGLKRMQKNLDLFFKELDLYAKVTGLKVNYDKTQLMRIGSLTNSNALYYMQKPISWSRRVKILGIVLSNNKDEIINCNYENAMSKMYKVLNSWQNRTLSIMGKIQVINALVIPLFIHLFTIIYSPTHESLLQIKESIMEFIWGKGVPKYKYDVLINDYCNGGLKLCDVMTKSFVLKVRWLKEAQETQKFWSYFTYYTLPLPLDIIMNTNIKPIDLKLLYKNNESIWLDIWEAWAKYKFHHVDSSCCSEILNQVIWFNSQIKVNNKCIYWKNWYDLGICYVMDLVNLSLGRLYTFEELKITFGLNIVNMLQYNQLISAIPKEWKKGIKNSINCVETVYNDCRVQNLFKKSAAKKIYWEILYRIKVDDVHKNKWERMLNTVIDSTSWESYCIKPFILTQCSKLRYFQHRVINNKIMTNSIRSRWDKTVDPLCYFCGKKLETMIHLFWECDYVQKLYKSFFKWFNYILDLDFEIIG